MRYAYKLIIVIWATFFIFLMIWFARKRNHSNDNKEVCSNCLITVPMLIIKYDFIENKYIVANKISDVTKIQTILNSLTNNQKQFKCFLAIMENMIIKKEKGC